MLPFAMICNEGEREFCMFKSYVSGQYVCIMLTRHCSPNFQEMPLFIRSDFCISVHFPKKLIAINLEIN